MVNQEAKRSPRSAGFAVATVAVAGYYWLRWSEVNSGNWVDLEVYLRGAHAIVTGTALYTSPAGVLPFTYSPCAAALFTPLLLLGAAGAGWALTAGSLVSYLVVVGFLGWRLRLPIGQLTLVALAGMAFEPFVRTLLLGQVNLYLMAAVVLDCLVIRSSRRGWLIGVVAGIKVVPGVFVLYFLLQRDWRSAARAGCGFLSTVLAGVIVAPKDSLRYWTGGLFGISHWGPIAVVDGKNQSLIGQLARISHNPSPAMVTALVLSATGLALGTRAAHRQLRIGEDVAGLTAVAIGGLLASPLSWTHHWVWGLPAVMVLVSRRQWVTAALLGSVFAAGAARGLTLHPFQDSLTFIQQLTCATYVAAGAGLLTMWAFGHTGGDRGPTAQSPNGTGRDGSSLTPAATFKGRPSILGWLPLTEPHPSGATQPEQPRRSGHAQRRWLPTASPKT